MARPEQAKTHFGPSFALALYVLGVIISLLALLGRVGQELQGRLLFDFAQSLSRTADSSEPALPALIDGLHAPEQRLVALGFVVGAAVVLIGGAWWRWLGKPALPHERAWTRLASAVAACLLLGMLAALVGSPPEARLVVVVVSLGLALAGFVVLVLLLLRGAPPAP